MGGSDGLDGELPVVEPGCYSLRLRSLRRS